MDGFVGSWGFAGSGWLLTLLGTGLAAFTLWQVVKRNNSFRLALKISMRRSSAEEFETQAQELERLAIELARTRKPDRVRKIATDWNLASGKAIAALEGLSSENPLSLASRDLSRWTNTTIKQWNKSVKARSANTPSDMETGHVAEGLRSLLLGSQDCAASVTREASSTAIADFEGCVNRTIGQVTYFRQRVRTARDDDLHDER